MLNNVLLAAPTNTQMKLLSIISDSSEGKQQRQLRTQMKLLWIISDSSDGKTAAPTKDADEITVDNL
jgi:hypothetical protein